MAKKSSIASTGEEAGPAGPGRVAVAPASNQRHPRAGLVLAALDLIGLGIALYLSITELQNKPLLCTNNSIFDCNAVAQSSYSRPFAGIPVAVYGVFLSLTLLVLAIAWWRTNNYKLLLLHYGLSLVGVLFEGWFQFVQIFKIGKLCIWCESYGISLVLRFVVALWVYMHTPKPDDIPVDELS
jgi:uncharacterized membrane protein